jgi:hypothetical protein
MKTETLNNKEAENWVIDKFRSGAKLTPADLQHAKDSFDVYPPEVERYFAWLHKTKPDEWAIDSKDSHTKAKVFLQNNYKISYNEVTGKREITNNKGHHVIIEQIWDELNSNKINYSTDKVRSLAIAVMNKYDPFKDYFKALPKWDGTDYITQVANCVKTDEPAFWHSMFKKALVRSIACAIGNKVNRMAIILISRKQNTGKTMFIRYLNPWGDTKYYCEEKMISGKTDSEMQLCENFIFNLDELQGMNQKDMEVIKSTISKSVINKRKAYREDNELYRRRCTFWGSSNKEEYLTDDTGNSRWLGFKVLEQIDWQTYNEIPVHYLWTQAYHLYVNGFDGELTAEEANLRDKRNSGMEQNSNEIDICSMLFSPSTDNFVSNADILRHYQTYFKNQTTTYTISRALVKLEFEAATKNIYGKTVRGFYLELVQLDNNNNTLTITNEDKPQPFGF